MLGSIVYSILEYVGKDTNLFVLGWLQYVPEEEYINDMPRLAEAVFVNISLRCFAAVTPPWIVAVPLDAPFPHTIIFLNRYFSSGVPDGAIFILEPIIISKMLWLTTLPVNLFIFSCFFWASMYELAIFLDKVILEPLLPGSSKALYIKYLKLEKFLSYLYLRLAGTVWSVLGKLFFPVKEFFQKLLIAYILVLLRLQLKNLENLYKKREKLGGYWGNTEQDLRYLNNRREHYRKLYNKDVTEDRRLFEENLEKTYNVDCDLEIDTSKISELGFFDSSPEIVNTDSQSLIELAAASGVNLVCLIAIGFTMFCMLQD